MAGNVGVWLFLVARKSTAAMDVKSTAGLPRVDGFGEPFLSEVRHGFQNMANSEYSCFRVTVGGDTNRGRGKWGGKGIRGRKGQGLWLNKYTEEITIMWAKKR